MTKEEAQKVANVVYFADGECYVCAGKLYVELQRLFPEHHWETLAHKAGWDHNLEEFMEEWGLKI